MFIQIRVVHDTNKMWNQVSSATKWISTFFCAEKIYIRILPRLNGRTQCIINRREPEIGLFYGSIIVIATECEGKLQEKYWNNRYCLATKRCIFSSFICALCLNNVCEATLKPSTDLWFVPFICFGSIYVLIHTQEMCDAKDHMKLCPDAMEQTLHSKSRLQICLRFLSPFVRSIDTKTVFPARSSFK